MNQWIALVGLKEISIKINAEDINFKLKKNWSENVLNHHLQKKVKIKHLFKSYFLETESKGDQSVQFSRSVMSNSLWPHESQHARPPCPSPTPRVYSNSCPLSRWCHPVISSSVVPFSSCPCEKAAKYDIGEGQKACITTMLTQNASESMEI